MSASCMGEVFKHSAQRGNFRLVMLAIADNAQDDGFCWPGAKHIARKTSLSLRSVYRIIHKLENDGELFVHRRRKEGQTNQYIVLLGMSYRDIVETLRTRFNYGEKKIRTIISGIRVARGNGVADLIEKVDSKEETHLCLACGEKFNITDVTNDITPCCSTPISWTGRKTKALSTALRYLKTEIPTWDGEFRSKEQRILWEKIEAEYSPETINSAIRWAAKSNIPSRNVVDRIIKAVQRNAQKTPEKAVVPETKTQDFSYMRRR